MDKGTTISMDLGDKSHHVCVLDADGAIIEQCCIANTFRGLEKFFKERESSVVAMEVGTHSPWISRALASWGHEPLVGNARKLRAIWDSSEKYDERDAEMLARIARFDPTLLYPVQHRGADAQADLAVVKARDLLVKERTRLINHTRNSVKSLGYRLPKCSPESFHSRVEDELPGELYPALIGIIEVVARLNQQIHNYDEQIRGLCEEHYPETKHLRQITGVGAVTSLGYVLTLEEPGRFKHSRQVGPFLGLTRRIDQSGQTDKQLPISKAGDEYLRRLLVGAAHYILGPFGPPCRLREHGERIAARGGKNAKKRAVVAVARKLAVLRDWRRVRRDAAAERIWGAWREPAPQAQCTGSGWYGGLPRYLGRSSQRGRRFRLCIVRCTSRLPAGFYSRFSGPLALCFLFSRSDPGRPKRTHGGGVLAAMRQRSVHGEPGEACA